MPLRSGIFFTLETSWARRTKYLLLKLQGNNDSARVDGPVGGLGSAICSATKPVEAPLVYRRQFAILGNRMMMLVDISMVAGVVPNRRGNRLLDVREATVSTVMANDREATFWRSQRCGRGMFTLR